MVKAEILNTLYGLVFLVVRFNIRNSKALEATPGAVEKSEQGRLTLGGEGSSQSTF